MDRDDELPQIVQQLRQRLPILTERYRVQSLGVFGSYVRQQQHAASDVDVLVTFEEPPSLLECIALENELSDILGIKVDLVMRDALRQTIGRHILREVVPV